MKITQVRNATLRIDYGGVRFLIDPMLAEPGAYPPFAGTSNLHLRNPLVPLSTPLSELLDVDAVIVTHLHADHWDAAAIDVIPKSMPIIAQNAEDADVIRGQGFADVRHLDQVTGLAEVALIKTGGQHGSDAAIEVLGSRLGKVCGVVFRHPAEKSLYLAGDTVWNRHVAAALAMHRPEVVILNAGAARIDAVGLIIMGTADVLSVFMAVPEARLVASHMEALNHCTLSRDELRTFAGEQGFSDRIDIPGDGEALTF